MNRDKETIEPPENITFERTPSLGYVKKLRALEKMRERFKKLPGKPENPKVKSFLRRYGDFMSLDNYRAKNPEVFMTAADGMIQEGTALLGEFGET